MAAVATGQGLVERREAAGSLSPTQTTDERIAASLQRIARGSALWRNEIEALLGNGRRAFVLKPEQVVVIDPATRSDVPQAFGSHVLAEVSPVIERDSRIGIVLIVVNLPLLDSVHRRRNSLPAERDADLDRILIHEVYGHAFPYLRAGDLSGRCPDPRPGEPPASACSIVRENAVRAELGLGQRKDYGLNGLLLASEPAWNLHDRALSVRR
jgi:hypothetical protein